MGRCPRSTRIERHADLIATEASIRRFVRLILEFRAESYVEHAGGHHQQPDAERREHAPDRRRPTEIDHQELERGHPEQSEAEVAKEVANGWEVNVSATPEGLSAAERRRYAIAPDATYRTVALGGAGAAGAVLVLPGGAGQAGARGLVGQSPVPYHLPGGQIILAQRPCVCNILKRLRFYHVFCHERKTETQKDRKHKNDPDIG